MSSLNADFWDDLKSLRSCSRLILVALENDDLDEVQRLSRESDRRLGRVKPAIEGRMQAIDRNEDDLILQDVLAGLKRMNDRILEELAEKTKTTLTNLENARTNRLRLSRHRAEVGYEQPALLDRSS